MLCTSTGNTTRKDLASLRYILLQLSCILVIDYVIFTTEYSNFLSSAHTAFFSHRRIGLLSLIKSHYYYLLSESVRAEAGVSSACH